MRKWLYGVTSTIALVLVSAFLQRHEQIDTCKLRAATAEATRYCSQIWWRHLITWPEGITCWAVIGTGFVIAWQSSETRKSATQTEKSVAIANRQIEMMRDKERARIEVQAAAMELHTAVSGSWHFTGSLKVRNLGPSRGYVNRFQAEMIWFRTDDEEPKLDIPKSGSIFPESYIDPTEDWDQTYSPAVYCWEQESVNLDWLASGVYSGRVRILIRGALEYETVGTAYKRVFIFEWKGNGRSDSFAMMLGGEEPTNNKERMSRGYWATTMNEERETANTQN